MPEKLGALRERLPKVGMRNIKTAVAVVVCYFLFYPLRWVGIGMEGTLGPFYASARGCPASLAHCWGALWACWSCCWTTG